MPIGILLMAVSLGLVVHAARTGRFSPWGYILLFLPGLGSLAYILVELVPEWLGSSRVKRSRKAVAQTLDPQKRYRALTDAVATVDTVGSRCDLGHECLALGRFSEAIEHFRTARGMPGGDGSEVQLGLAEGYLGLGHHDEAIAVYQRLKAEHPDAFSARAALSYAQALAETGRYEMSLDAFEGLERRNPSFEARARHAALLAYVGRTAEGRQMAKDLLERARLSPAHVRKLDAAWIRMARETVART